jgi:hypothetical protein
MEHPLTVLVFLFLLMGTMPLSEQIVMMTMGLILVQHISLNAQELPGINRQNFLLQMDGQMTFLEILFPSMETTP